MEGWAMKKVLTITIVAMITLSLACLPLGQAEDGKRGNPTDMDLLILGLELHAALGEAYRAAIEYIELAKKADALALVEGGEKDYCRYILDQSANMGFLLDQIEGKATRIIVILEKARELIGKGGDSPDPLMQAVESKDSIPEMQDMLGKTYILRNNLHANKKNCEVN